MTIDIDRTDAFRILADSYERCSKHPVDTCAIKDTIDFVLQAKKSLTYRYIMFTAITAKVVRNDVDPLSLQANDSSDGAYDARSLCHYVVYPFQQRFLGDTIDGSNNDPLVNKPGRFPRLSANNAAQKGDPQKCLEMLCGSLPHLQTSQDARTCLDYLVSRLIVQAEAEKERKQDFQSATEGASLLQAREFIDELLDKGFGGAGLVIATAALYMRAYLPDEGCEVRPHPANQAGTSSKQASDLDVILNGRFWLATELKDKPFTEADVSHAVDTAFKAGVRRILFIAGRQSSIDGQTAAYFSDIRRKWMERGLYVGVMPVDALVDHLFATNDFKAAEIYESIQLASGIVKNIEASMWIYDRVTGLKKES